MEYLSNLSITGSVNIAQDLTVKGEIIGTSSFATTASFITGSDVVGTVTSSSYAVTASYLDGDIPTTVQTYKTTTQSIPFNTVTTVVDWDTTNISQNASEWNSSTGIFTATKAGTYRISAKLTFTTFSSNANSEVAVGIQKNSVMQGFSRNFSPVNSTNVLAETGFVTVILQLDPGDTFNITAYQNSSGASRNLHGNGNNLNIEEIPSRITR